MDSLAKKSLPYLLLIILIAVSELALYRWCKKDTLPLSWDESIHTQLAIEYKTRLETEGVRGVLHPAYFNYPPAFHLILGTVLDIPKDPADAGAIVNGVVLAFLIVLIFLMGNEWIGPWQGLTAAFIFSTYPAVVDLTRATMIDLMLTLWVVLGFYALVRSDYFNSLFWSVIFGVVSALGLLTKWSYGVYLLVPLLISLFQSARYGYFKKAFLSLLIGGVLIFPWYAENLFPVLAMFRRATSLAPASGQELSGWRNSLWYVFNLGEALNLYYLVLLLPGLISFVWRPKMSKILIWFVSGLVLFTLIRNHNIRYAVPVFPAAALLSVAWIPSERKWLAGVLLAGCVGFFAFQQASFAKYVSTNVAGVSVRLFCNRPPIAQDWKHQEILQKIREMKTKDQFSRIVVLSNDSHFHSTTLNVSAAMQGVHDFEFCGPSRDRWLDFKDFVLVKTGDLGPAETLGVIQPAADMVRTPPAWFAKTYKEVGRWPLPGASEGILYQARPDPANNFKQEGIQLSLKTLALGRIEIENLELRLTPMTAADSARGIFKELRLKATKIRSKDLEFQNADLILSHPQINLPRFLETGEIQIIHADSLEPHLLLDGNLISSYAEKKIKGLTNPKISFEGSEVRLEATLHKVPLTLAFSATLAPQTLTLRLEEAKAGWLPLPKIFFSGLTDRIIPLVPNSEIPFRLNLGALSGTGTQLRIGQ